MNREPKHIRELIKATIFLRDERQPEVDLLHSSAVNLNKSWANRLYKSKDSLSYKFGSVKAYRLDFRRLPGPVFDPPRREAFGGMSVGSFSRTAAGN